MQNQKKINIITNNNFKSKKTSLNLIEQLKNHGFIASERYSSDAVLNIAIGGDGSFLRAIHRNKYPDIPFVGINTGHLGFFQEIKPENINEFIKQYILEEYKQEEMYLIDTTVITNKDVFHLKSINEIVVKGADSKVLHLDLFIDNNHLEKFSGDGLIISTPAGSTAYSFSVGGSIVYPTLESIQVSPLAPINSKAFRSLSNSVIVPGDIEVAIEPETQYNKSTLIVNDGMEIKYNCVKRIEMKISDDKVYKLTFDDNTYWDNLKNKFL